MATGSVSILLLLLSFSMSTSSTLAFDDEAALLAFKAAAISGGSDDPLPSWNRSAGQYCSWEGVRCRGRRRRVVALNLPSRGLTGVLSPAVGNLSSLRLLNLTTNRLRGDIPASLGRLHRLHALNLSLNAFSGEFPANLTSCTSLTILGLQSNHLHGRIPSNLGSKLTRLKRLILWQNNLSGAIPATLGNMSSLGFVSLAYNQLQGTIPPGLGDMIGLRNLDLAFNHLSGEPPRSMYNLSSVRVLQIQGNMLRGGIPADIGSTFPSIRFLNLAGNHFTGHIPASLSNLTTLMFLDITDNSFAGYVPPTLGKLQALEYANLASNKLQGDDSKGWEFITSLSNCSQLLQLNIYSNAGLTGQLPDSIGNLSTSLQVLRFDQTGISGNIPTSISNLANLAVFSVANTSISGVIPESIGKLANLVKLGLFNTNLSGRIPSSIGNLSKLTILDAYHCNLEGQIPASIGMMNNLLSLDLSNNRLNDSIPRDIFKLPVISIYINLSYNSLSGPLSSEVGRFGNLNNLVLSGNKLSGGIPDSIGECAVLQGLWLDDNSFVGSIPQSLSKIKGLSALNLSFNKLYGNIPDAIGGIHNLEQLNLAHNNLSGLIPASLQNLMLLSEVDLSFNNLQGEVPKEGIFRYLTKFSVIGNSELCGGLPQLHLDPCQTSSIKKNRKWKLKRYIIALTTTGALLFLVFVIALLRCIKKKLRRKHIPFLTPIVEEQYERVSYHELVKGTNGFSEVNLLGKGSFGVVYKCTFENDETITAVKVFNLQPGSTRSFVTECEALKRVRHRCLVKIITCCSSINQQGQEFKALIFEFMPNGSLNDWLHPKSDTLTPRNTLSIKQRLDIAADIMDALDYLHNHCQPPIAHCDLKPSNILIAEDMSARVGDFGISRILLESTSRILQNSSSTIGIKGTVGYVAPEYGEGYAVSTIGDVYSLGILLLEMFTGRSPTDDMFGDMLDLHKYVEHALSEMILDAADLTLWLHVESTDSIIEGKIKDCLVSVFRLAISCSKHHPKERTTMRDAAAEIHAIRESYHMLPC